MSSSTRRTLGLLAGVAAAAVAIVLVRAVGRPSSVPAPVPVPADTATATPPAARARLFATIGDSASRIEGIAEHGGMLYVADWKDGGVYRIGVSDGRVERVGQLPTKPGETLLGVATDSAGSVYVAAPETGLIYRIDAARLGAADFKPRRDVEAFASGAKGANGLAFDANGHLWISAGDGNAVYHVGPKGGMARVFAKGYALTSGDTTMPVRAYVANGLGIDSAGNIYTGNTGTGEITRIEVTPGYALGAITMVARDPRLLGADGLLVDHAGNIWVSANFSNTLARVSPAGEVTIVLHDSTASVLHFPAELKRVGQTFYLANLNFPFGANAGTTIKGAQVVAVEVP